MVLPQRAVGQVGRVARRCWREARGQHLLVALARHTAHWERLPHLGSKAPDLRSIRLGLQMNPLRSPSQLL
jgi:hypothetical protein